MPLPLPRLMRASATMLAALFAAAAGPAPERPVIPPTRDAILGYHLRPATGEPIDVRVLIRSGARTIRVDLPDTSFILIAPAARNVAMVVPLEQTVAEMQWEEGPQGLFMLDDKARYTRRAEMTVAGQRCTQWDSQLDAEKHTLCVTADGLVLRNQFVDAQGRRNLVEAFALRYETLPDTDFRIPAGFDVLRSNGALVRSPTR